MGGGARRICREIVMRELEFGAYFGERSYGASPFDDEPVRVAESQRAQQTIEKQSMIDMNEIWMREVDDRCCVRRQCDMGVGHKVNVEGGERGENAQLPMDLVRQGLVSFPDIDDHDAEGRF